MIKHHFFLASILILFTLPAVALEKPEYEVLYQDGKIEYRLYQPYIVAQTNVSVEDEYNGASNEGFRRLFKYITGANNTDIDIAMTAPVQMNMDNAGEKIAMTAPVQQKSNGDFLQVAFMLPSKFNMDTAPAPTDERVFIREIPGRIMAVIRYSGRWTDRNRAKYEKRLRKNLQSHGIDTVSGAETAAYNPPFTPPFLRRNEIMFEVREHPSN
jgi:hypothetical protein